jgi:hypothetical protein
MEKKNFDISYRNDSGQILECRQCSHMSEWQAAHEAELYVAWAEYHYGCKVYFSIHEQ